jgi:hypothetical protein
MTINDAINRVKLFSHRGNQAITTDQITTDILNCLNESWVDLCQLLPRQAFRQDSDTNGTNITTVNGQDIYSLAGNPYPVQELVIIHYFFNNVNYNMKKCESEREFWGQYFYLSTAVNRPFVYVPYGFDNTGVKQIRLFPVPDQNYNLKYTFYIDPTTIDFKALLLSAQIPFLPSYLQTALWKGALYYFLKAFDDPAQVNAKADYESAKVRQDISEDADMDSDLQFRFDTARTRFVDPITGIRLQ